MTPAPDRTLSGVGLVLVGVGSVQVGAAVATLLFPLAGPGGAVWLRLLLSAVLLAVLWPPSRLPWVAMLRPRRVGAAAGGEPRSLGWDRRTWVTVIVFGAVLAGMNWSFYESLARIPLGIAVAVEFAGPLALSMALSRRYTDAAWAVLAAAGLAGLVLARAATGGTDLVDTDLVGVGFAAIAGALWAAYILVSQRVGRLVPGMRGLSVALVVGAILTTPVGLAAGGRLWDWRVFGLAAAVALLSTAVAYGVELEALRRLPARVLAVLMSIEPAVAALIGLVLLGQLLAASEWWGIAAICLASVGATLTAARGRTIPAPTDPP